MSNENVSTTLTSSILGFLTLIATLMALVPAFLSLNDKQANIYYSYKTSHISIPATMDANLAIKTLEEAGVPASTVELVIINQGNSGANNIKFEIITPTEILSAWTEPSSDSKPIWVDIPKLDVSLNKIASEINNLAATKPVNIFAGYKYEKPKEVKVSVFFNGQPASYVQNIDEVPRWSEWDVFILPAYIFATGLGLIFIWLFLQVLARNPKFRHDLLDIFIDITHVGYSPRAVKRIIENIKEGSSIKVDKKLLK